MEAILKRRLSLQLLFILLAAILVAALSVILISDAVKSAEGVVVNDASRTLAGAVSELDQQYQERAGSDSAWRALTLASQDTSLRGTSQAVLHSYPGVEGGYYDGMHFLGYSYPTTIRAGRRRMCPSRNLTTSSPRLRRAGLPAPQRGFCEASATSSSSTRKPTGRPGTPVGQ